MRMSEMYPSKYLAAVDVDDAGGDIVATVKAVRMERVKNSDGEEDDKPALHFREPTLKPMLLNKTNATALATMLGDDSDTWIGKKVTIGTEMVTAFGKTAPALRVRMGARRSARPPVEDEVEYITLAQRKELAEIAVECDLGPDEAKAVVVGMGCPGTAYIPVDRFEEAKAALIACARPHEEEMAEENPA